MMELEEDFVNSKLISKEKYFIIFNIVKNVVHRYAIEHMVDACLGLYSFRYQFNGTDGK